MTTKTGVLVVGDGLVDLLGEDGSTRLSAAASFRRHAGGAALNTAVALARLGCQPALLTVVGADPFGRFLIDSCRRAGVSVEPAVISRDGQTAVACAVSSPQSSEFCCLRSTPPVEANLQIADLPSSLPAYLYMTALLPVSLAPPPVVAELLRRARVAETLVCYDPNLANGGLPVRQLVARVEGCFQGAAIVKLSRDDGQRLYPGVSIQKLCQLIARCGPTVVIVTEGAAGCCGYVREQYFSLSAAQVDVVDALGAGDAFSAGLVYGLSRRGVSLAELSRLPLSTVRECCREATAAAAAACTAAGARQGLGDEQTLTTLVATVQSRC